VIACLRSRVFNAPRKQPDGSSHDFDKKLGDRRIEAKKGKWQKGIWRRAQKRGQNDLLLFPSRTGVRL
jgi:hypothetical protein